MENTQKVQKTNKKSIFKNNLFVLAIIIVGIVIILSLATDYFFSITNLSAIMTQMALTGILAVGMTFCIITEGVDLSAGNVLSLVGIILAVCLRAGIPLILALIIALCTGALCGLITGLLIAKGKLPAFIATLGMMNIAQGVALVISNGTSIYGYTSALVGVGAGKIGFVPITWIFMFVCFVIGYFILHWTKLGRYVYMVGGNQEASRLSGVNVAMVKTVVFTIAGICCGIAGILMTGRLNSADPNAGNNMQMDAIAAAIIGGTSMSGGEGKIAGTFLGAIIMASVKNGMIQLGLSSYPQQIVVGAIIILVVLLDMLNKSRKKN